MRGRSGVVFFRNKGEKGCIEGLEDLPEFSGVLDDFPNILPDNALTVMKEV